MQKMYTVLDHASNLHLKPFCFPTDRDAKEGFKHVCNDPETQYSKHPQDFTLIHIADFDEHTGKITPLDTYFTVARALELVEEK